MATPIPANAAAFSIDEAAEATEGAIVSRGAGAPGAFVTTDSRAAKPGAVFVALRGEAHDAHAYLAQVAAAGASFAIVSRGRGASVPAPLGAIEVDDTLVALGALARAHVGRWRAALVEARASNAGSVVEAVSTAGDPEALRAVVAITGSAGKTTTKELTAALLGAIAPTHFTAGNLNNRIGVPMTVLTLAPSHRFAVVEMGMSVPGEIAAVAAIAEPDVAVVTNVGLAHAEGVGGPEGVMREKGAVYRALDAGGVAVVNADDPLATRAADGAAGARVTFGRAEGADYRLVSRSAEGFGSRVEIDAAGRCVVVHLPLAGEVAAIDLAAALAAQEAASGVRLAEDVIDRALAGVSVAGRGAVRALGGDVVVIDDTYNANPASVRAALRTLAELGASRRRVVVLGEMKELGEHALPEHAALGAPIAEAGVALAIGCGGLANLALDRAEALGVEVVRASSTEEAAREAAARVRSGDAVLVKGSRSVGAERAVAALSEAWPSGKKPATSGEPG